MSNSVNQTPSKSSLSPATKIVRDNQDEPVYDDVVDDKKVRFVLTEKEIERETTVGLANVTFVSCAFSVILIPALGIQFLVEVRHRGLLTFVHVLTRDSLFNVSVFFLSIKVIEVLKFKKTFQMGIIGYGIYALVNLFYTWATVITTSLLFGTIVCHMWVAVAIYIALSAFSCSELCGSCRDYKLAHYFGVFQFLMYVSTFVDSAASMFLSDRRLDEYSDIAFPKCYNSTFIDEYCGVEYRLDNNLTQLAGNGSCSTNFHSYQAPNTITANFTIVIYIVMFALASYIVHSTVKEVDISSRDKTSGKVYFHGLRLLRERRLMLLIPITIYVGFQSFLSHTILQAYIACAVGDALVSYMRILACLTSCSICLLYKLFIRRIGRKPMLCLAIIIDIAIMIVCLLLSPYPEQSFVFYSLTTLWGVRDAIWEIENIIDFALYFPTRLPEAFVNFHFWRRIGIILYHVLKKYYTTRVLINVSLALLGSSVIAIGILKFSSSKIGQRDDDNPGAASSKAQRHKSEFMEGRVDKVLSIEDRDDSSLEEAVYMKKF